MVSQLNHDEWDDRQIIKVKWWFFEALLSYYPLLWNLFQDLLWKFVQRISENRSKLLNKPNGHRI